MYIDINERAKEVHKNNEKWWIDLVTGDRLDRNKGELLALVVSEISEALEGERKNIYDDHLPNRLMAEVEMADAYIRMLDFSAGLGYEINQFDVDNIVLFENTNNKFEELLHITRSVIKLYDIFDYGSRYDINNAITDVLCGIMAYCKKYGYDIEGAYQEKNEYNKTRKDHSKAARLADGGKKN